jgi:intracellular sulfur oxidation DsrE/DsrF family protein
MGATKRLLNDIQAGKVGSSAADEEIRLVANAKSVALLTLGMAYQKFGAGIETQQEVMMNVADITMEAFAMESALLRTRKVLALGKATIAGEMNAVFLRDAMARIEISARNLLGACSDAGMLRANMSILRKLTVYDPLDAVTARRTIATRLLAREKFVV